MCVRQSERIAEAGDEITIEPGLYVGNREAAPGGHAGGPIDGGAFAIGCGRSVPDQRGFFRRRNDVQSVRTKVCGKYRLFTLLQDKAPIRLRQRRGQGRLRQWRRALRIGQEFKARGTNTRALRAESNGLPTRSVAALCAGSVSAACADAMTIGKAMSAMTELVPMMIPRTDRNDRSLCSQRLLTARLRLR